MLEDAVVNTLRLRTNADAQCVGLLVAGARALVHAQCAVAVAEGVALDAGLSIDPGIDHRAQPLANLCGRVGIMTNGKSTGIGLLLLVARSLVDREVALVLSARSVDVGVVDDRRLGECRCTAKHGDNQQRTIHLNGLPL
ncbi:hypothetical protein EMIT0P294_10833 [Pseudomonas sp. IT-P294]